MKIKDSFDKVFGDINRVMVVMAHPDDNEVICGATIARLIREGKKIRLIVTTTGSKGFQDKNLTEEEFDKLRTEEQILAGEKLGIDKEANFNLGIPDGELELSLENIKKIVFHIRQFKPDLVITHCPDEIINTFRDGSNWVNHRDHRHTALLTVDAVYPYSRDRGFFPDQFGKEGIKEGYVVKKLLFSDAYTHPQRVYFKVTKDINKKRQALKVCKSVIEEGHVEEYVDESRYGDEYFEVLRFIEIY